MGLCAGPRPIDGTAGPAGADGVVFDVAEKGLEASLTRIPGHEFLEGVSGDAYTAFLAVRFEEAEEVVAIGVAGKDSLAVVAALGEMEPVAGRGEAISAGQSGFGASVY